MRCSSLGDFEGRAAEGHSEVVRLRGTIRLLVTPPTPDEVARFMGMPDADASGPELSRTIRGGLALAEPLLNPVAIWGLPCVHEVSRDAIRLGFPEAPAIELPCRGSMFRGAQMVQLGLITLGKEVDELLTELYSKDSLLAMAVDATASAAISRAGASFLTKRRQALRSQGLQLGVLFSPGCQALPLTAQRQIFMLLEPGRIGVELSQDCLMRPAKSATSVGPVGKSLPKWMTEVTACQLCSLRKTCGFKATRTELD